MSTAQSFQLDTTAEAAHDLACETLYRFLAAAFSAPTARQWPLLRDRASQQAARVAADLLREEFIDQSVPLALGELPAEELDARRLLEALDRPVEDLLAEHVRVFGLVNCRECPPYETEYHTNEDTFFRSQQMADISGFYRAFGLDPAGKGRERSDHLSLELEFAALLLTKKRLALETDADAPDAGAAAVEHAEICQQARTAYLRDHLCWWTPSFTLLLRRKAERGMYQEAAQLLAALLPLERSRLNVPPPPLPIRDPNSGADERPEACEGCLLQS